jgi:phytoene/squalene synthetase
MVATGDCARLRWHAAASGGAGAGSRRPRIRAAPEQFQTIIDGMAMDLTQARYLDFPALELYCHRVAGVVGLMSAEIFGYADPQTKGFARDLGWHSS